MRAVSRSIILHIIGLTIYFWLYHKFAAFLIKDMQIKLGVISPQTAPLYATLRTNLDLWVIPAIMTLMTHIVVFRLFLEKRKVPGYMLLPIFILMLILIDTTVAMVDGGLKAFAEPYTRKDLEYYADVPKVEGIRAFLGDYVAIHDKLSGHSQTHPPGGVLFLYVISHLFGNGLLQAALSTVLFTSLSVIPLYFLAKQFYGDNVAKYSLALFLVTPNMVMFTATAMDGPFSVFPILSVCLFYKALLSGNSQIARTVLYSVLTGLALGLGMLMNYTTIFIGVLLIITTIIMFFTKHKRFKAALIALFIAGVAFMLFYLFLYLWARYNFFSALWAAYKKDEKGMGTGYENPVRYFGVSTANLFAFLIGVGIPLTATWLHEIMAEFSRIIRSRTDDIYILACLLTLLGASFSTLFTLEVERIWIFMVPFIVIPAAKHLYEKHRPYEFYTVVILMCVQILLTEVFLYTYW